MSIALGRLAEEDPTFQVRSNEETGQTEISGMGELHLEVIVDRMRREFGVEANVGRPQVSYRETVRGSAENVEGKFVRRRAARGQYGVVNINLSPRPARASSSSTRSRAARSPRSTCPRSRRASRRRSRPGSRPATRWSTCASPSSTASTTTSTHRRSPFNNAGSLAFKEAAKRAKPVLLEPIFAVEVVAPEEFLGTVIGDLLRAAGASRARSGAETRIVVSARVPLSEMFGYATDLRSNTQGRANYTMQFDAYEEVPGNLAEQITEQRARGAGDPRRTLGFVTGTSKLDRFLGFSAAAASLQVETGANTKWRSRSLSASSRTSTSGPSVTSTMARPRSPLRSLRCSPSAAALKCARSSRSTTLPRRRNAGSRSRLRTSSIRPRTATMRTSTAPATPTTSRT